MTDLEMTSAAQVPQGALETGTTSTGKSSEPASAESDLQINDEQAMALVKKFRLKVAPIFKDYWSVCEARLCHDDETVRKDLNRAICECVAKMQKERAK